jgi:large subunit ribosomal protein L17
MRHGKRFNHLGRKKGHREAMLSNMASSLIEHKRIFTTTAKAKALRGYIEPLITKSKSDTTQNRRIVFKYLKNKEAVRELFSVVAEKIGDRPGGYTRVLKTHNRLGDNAEMCMMELVDFNELMLEAKESGKKSTGKKRSRRGSGKKKTTETTAPKAEEVVEVVAEEVAPETPEEAPAAAVDDLTKIEGIGPKIAEALTAAGVASFADLASKSADDVKAILDAAEGNFGAHDPATWPKQADMAAKGEWDELKKWQDELDGGKE